MNKAELISEVAIGAKINKRQAKRALDFILNSITVALRAGDTVKISGFGTFSVVRRASRRILNLQTGKRITIKAKKVAKFKAGVYLTKKIK